MPFLSQNVNIQRFWTQQSWNTRPESFLLVILCLGKRPHINEACLHSCMSTYEHTFNISCTLSSTSSKHSCDAIFLQASHYKTPVQTPYSQYNAVQVFHRHHHCHILPSSPSLPNNAIINIIAKYCHHHHRCHQKNGLAFYS